MPWGVDPQEPNMMIRGLPEGATAPKNIRACVINPEKDVAGIMKFKKNGGESVKLLVIVTDDGYQIIRGNDVESD